MPTHRLFVAAVAAVTLTLSASPVLGSHRGRAARRGPQMCDEALATLVKAKPEMKARIDKAAGYGCFSSFGISFLVGGAGGRGLVHNRATARTRS